jgi:hypothetical protein
MTLTILRHDESIPQELRTWDPRSLLGESVQKALPFLPRELALELVERVSSAGVIESSLALVHFKADGIAEDLGVVSRKVVTDAGVGFIVDAFQNLTELETMKYHGVGTGTTAEAAGQTALVTESTTALNPDSTRATGSTIENGANVYRTVGTLTFDAAAAVTEHGIFNQAATGGGVLLDRSVFAAVNVSGGDSLQATYDLTFTAGG